MKRLYILFIVLMTCSTVSAQIIGDRVVKIIRVSFQEDDADGTTGNGDFLYTAEYDTCGNYAVDPAPHDKTYFISQLKAVDNYFRNVSYGKFGINLDNSRVYPDDNQSSYVLSNTMDSYHPYGEDDIYEQRLTELFKEAVELAYSTDGFEPSNDDLIVVIHAGIGQDFSLPFLDPTPEDIPSTYVDGDMLQTYNNGPITIGNSTVEHGIILPETQNHLLYDIAESMFAGSATPCEYQFGLTGTFALMMGFAVGLPPLWDTESGQSGIGVFGLMDQGSNNGRGMVPAPPDAWTRKYAGWEEPAVVKPGTHVQLAVRSEDNLIQLDINTNEHFLIENRTNWFREDVSVDSARYLMYEQSGKDRYPPFVEVLFDSVAIEKDENGVVTSIPNYDIGLPASGLLIWHIDKNRINSGLSSYSVNGNREKRGVDLEEADGAQDIGYPNIFLFADPTGGYFGDMWFQGNPEYEALYPDQEGQQLEFGPFTYPNTKSNDGATTYLSISNIGLANDTMSFSVTNTMLADDFPDTSLHIGLINDFDDDGVMEIVGGKDSLWVVQEEEISNKFFFYSTTRDIYDLSVGNFDGKDRLIVLEKDSLNAFISYFDFNTVQHIFELVSLDTLNYTNAVFVNDPLGNHQYKQSSDDFFYSASVINNDGSIDSVRVSASMADLDLDGSTEYIYESYLISGDPLSVINIEAKHLNGITVSGFPLDTMTTRGTPLIKDLIGDEHPEIVVQNAEGEIIIINWQGELEYRLTDYGNLICLSEYEGRNAIVTESAIWLFDEVSENYGNEWTSTHHDFGNTRTLHLNIPRRIPESALIDKDKTYAYPNPVYDGKVKLRIAVESADKVEIMIYDFAGFFVKKFTMDNLTQGFIHEEWWNVDDVESGVYFANITATSGTKSESEILKIGVIK
ncbi:MAG: T9SS type A sorting domain-containing protein [Candidatus Marinimicrobia bacterium]|nr:T9SS type A sorting domain-containing protein [Candidatus Neomarinimicrobiota bacterium]